MNTALQNLNFIINLTDRVSGPMGHIMRSVDQVSAGFKKGFSQIAYGTAGLAASAYTISNLLEPTKNMQRALGEVKSLGVTDDTLNKLRDTALKFSTQYGGSAADVVRSSYEIQSAISGLSGDELAAFTNVSGILAKGTKANVTQITDYVGTMYGIFQQNADAMGKAKWIEQLAAQTAMAVNIFKADGKKVADAFTTIGASAQVAGISLSEQFAVLGTMGAAMSGSEAGTKYRAFLDNIGKAQTTLGLTFTDSQDHILPMVDILEKINAKFGDIGKVANQDLLKKAFGSDEAVSLVTLLSSKVEGLQNNISQIGQQNNLNDLLKMADAMTDPWAKMSAGVEALSINLGTKLLPIINPVIDSINEIMKKTGDWADAYPDLAKNLAQIGLMLIGVTAAASAFTLFSGLATVSTALWQLSLNLILKPLWALSKAIWAALPSIWGFTTALLANPITWWVVGIAAVVGLVAAAVIYWDQWTAVVSGWANSFMIGLAGIKNNVVDLAGRFLEMIGVFSLVDKAIAAWDALKGWWAGFKNWLAGLNPFGAIIAGINQAIGLVNHLPGVNISPIATTPAPVSTGPKGAAAGGGLMKQFSSVMTSNSSKTIGDVHVHNYGQPMSGTKLLDELSFAGG